MNECARSQRVCQKRARGDLRILLSLAKKVPAYARNCFGHCDIEVVEKNFLEIRAKSSTAVLGPRISRLGKSNLVLPIGGLTGLARQVQESMEPQKSPKHQLPFVGHLTLGRIKDANRANLEGTPFSGSFVVTELQLVQSVLGAEGPTHTTVNRLQLLPQFE